MISRSGTFACVAGLILCLSACGLWAKREDPMVWVTRDSGHYHTTRCVGLPAGAQMERLSYAEKEGLSPCSVCTTVILPGDRPAMPAPAPSKAASAPEPPPVPEPEALPATTPDQPELTVVYLRTGDAHYHRSTCPAAAQGTAVHLRGAVQRGYQACPRCAPSQLPYVVPLHAAPTPPTEPGPQLVIPGRR